uniref:Uncharacterized protein n=1 Tax=Anguilla anguilla TaxID=7936 RepID=A0A0E9U283_ANGAN
MSTLVIMIIIPALVLCSVGWIQVCSINHLLCSVIVPLS